MLVPFNTISMEKENTSFPYREFNNDFVIRRTPLTTEVYIAYSKNDFVTGEDGATMISLVH